MNNKTLKKRSLAELDDVIEDIIQRNPDWINQIEEIIENKKKKQLSKKRDMKKLITEMAEVTCSGVKWLDSRRDILPERWEFTTEDLERFATVIVRECAGICKDRGDELAIDRPNKDFDIIAWNCEEAILEHFGIKK